jgi:hypothetical protein
MLWIFQYTAADLINLEVLEQVASFRTKPYSMELVLGEGEEEIQWNPLDSWQGLKTFEEQTWVVPSVLSGNHN